MSRSPLESACIAALALTASAVAQSVVDDPRTSYDVQSYRLELRVDPEQERIAGTCTVEARVTAAELKLVRLDMDAQLVAEAAWLEPGAAAAAASRRQLELTRDGDWLDCKLPESLAKDTTFRISVRYAGAPRSLNDFDGFHWKKTLDGAPWIATSCQTTGSRAWWPGKDSFFHPEDKPERFELVATVPAGLYAVANGRLKSRARDGEWETFHWRHDYPLETYSVALNVAPYVVVESELELDGIEQPVPFIYYVLPEAKEKAALQFAEVPQLVRVFGEAFGPFPFPKSKIAFVHTPFWGMEHSTAIAYGSSFPAWIAAERARDPKIKLRDRYGGRNKDYDYILVHEFAHEWWGNAVSAADWADFWLHEGFATYAEGVYVERTAGREAADRWWSNARPTALNNGSLYRGQGSDSEEAYDTIIYTKGAWVLHTLRTFVDDDAAWWKALREFNLDFRYRNATTDDFRAHVDRATGREWKPFFEEWFRGDGYPVLEGQVTIEPHALRVRILGLGSAKTQFHVPLDLAWVEDEEPRTQRVMLEPGDNELSIATEHVPRDVKLTSLQRLLGKFEVEVVNAGK